MSHISDLFRVSFSGHTNDKSRFRFIGCYAFAIKGTDRARSLSSTLYCATFCSSRGDLCDLWPFLGRPALSVLRITRSWHCPHSHANFAAAPGIRASFSAVNQLTILTRIATQALHCITLADNIRVSLWRLREGRAGVFAPKKENSPQIRLIKRSLKSGRCRRFGGFTITDGLTLHRDSSVKWICYNKYNKYGAIKKRKSEFYDKITFIL